MNDEQLDRRLTRLARAARDTEATAISREAVDLAYKRVIDRGGLTESPPPLRRREGVRRLSMWAAVVASVSLVGGLIVWQAGRDQPTVLVSETVATPAPSSPATTRAPTTSAAATTTVRPAPAAGVIAVDAADPPPLVEPQPIATVPFDAGSTSRGFVAAIGPDGTIAVHHRLHPSVSLIRPGGGAPRSIAVDRDVLGPIVLGPDDVLYGYAGAIPDPDGLEPTWDEFVALALGDETGRVVASELVDYRASHELSWLGIGASTDGVVDRQRVAGAVLMQWVDRTGQPAPAIDGLPPTPTVDRVDRPGEPGTTMTIAVPDGPSWELAADRDPSNSLPIAGPPAWTTSDRVIYTERIGADIGGIDAGPSAMPVIAVLEADGSGQWVRLPDDWYVAASEPWGTVLLRVVEGAAVVEVALLDDALRTAGVVE